MSDASLTWTAATVAGATITGYSLYRKVGAGAFELLALLSGTTLAYTDVGLTPAVAYQYRLIAHASNSNDSQPSNTVSLNP